MDSVRSGCDDPENIFTCRIAGFKIEDWDFEAWAVVKLFRRSDVHEVMCFSNL